MHTAPVLSQSSVTTALPFIKVQCSWEVGLQMGMLNTKYCGLSFTIQFSGVSGNCANAPNFSFGYKYSYHAHHKMSIFLLSLIPITTVHNLGHHFISEIPKLTNSRKAENVLISQVQEFSCGVNNH